MIISISIIRPILKYGCEIWTGITQKRLKTFEKKLRIIRGPVTDLNTGVKNPIKNSRKTANNNKHTGF